MIPSIYAEWVTVLNELAEGTNDQEVLENIQKGTFSADGQALLRLVKRFSSVIEKRVNRQKARWSNQSYTRTELDLERELYAVRKEFIFLLKVVDVPALTEEYRLSLKEKIQELADETQRSLETGNVMGVGRIEYIVRSTPVNRLGSVTEDYNDE